jgi:hypothetical protein
MNDPVWLWSGRSESAAWTALNGPYRDAVLADQYDVAAEIMADVIEPDFEYVRCTFVRRLRRPYAARWPDRRRRWYQLIREIDWLEWQRDAEPERATAMERAIAEAMERAIEAQTVDALPRIRFAGSVPVQGAVLTVEDAERATGRWSVRLEWNEP